MRHANEANFGPTVSDTVKKEPLSSYAPNPTHDQYLTLGLGLGGVGNR